MIPYLFTSWINPRRFDPFAHLFNQLILTRLLPGLLQLYFTKYDPRYLYSSVNVFAFI